MNGDLPAMRRRHTLATSDGDRDNDEVVRRHQQSESERVGE
jgi:hypothetical protein